MSNGTWRLLADRASEEFIIFCDTPDVRINLLPDEIGERVVLTRAGGERWNSTDQGRTFSIRVS